MIFHSKISASKGLGLTLLLESFWWDRNIGLLGVPPYKRAMTCGRRNVAYSPATHVVKDDRGLSTLRTLHLAYIQMGVSCIPRIVSRGSYLMKVILASRQCLVCSNDSSIWYEELPT